MTRYSSVRHSAGDTSTSNSTLSGFWVEELSDLTRFDTFIQTEQPRQGVPEDNLDEPILLPSVQAQIVATSQLFFEEPWVNIDYADREAETTRLFSVYRQAISDRLGDEGVDMDQLFKVKRLRLTSTVNTLPLIVAPRGGRRLGLGRG